MHRQITFDGVKSSPAIEAYANKLLDKIMLLLKKEPTPIYLELILRPSKVHAHHKVELLLKSPNFDLISAYEGSDVYKVLNRVFSVMIQELKKQKGKNEDKYKTENIYKGA